MNKERCLTLIRSFTPTEDASDERLIDTTGSSPVFFTAAEAVSTLQIMFKAGAFKYTTQILSLTLIRPSA
jgi:hypothetical protein